MATGPSSVPPEAAPCAILAVRAGGHTAVVVLAAVCTVAVAAVLTTLTFLIVPEMERVFRTYVVPLPDITKILLDFNRFCLRGGIVVFWAMAVAAPLLVHRLSRRPAAVDRRILACIILVVLLLAIGAFLCIGLALIIPQIPLFS